MRTSLLLVFVVSSISVSATLTGCSSSENDDEPIGMTVQKVCIETQCDARYRRDREACSRCMDACFGASFSCDPSRSCSASCGSTRPCSDAELAACEKEGFRTELGSESSSDLEAACKRFFEHLASCNLEVPDRDASVCSTWAKIERPETAKLYDCSIAQGCTADSTTCSLPPATFGDEICGALEETCGSPICTEGKQAALNAVGPWLRDDVIAAGKSCVATASCSDAQDCLQSWIDAARL